MLTPVHQNIDVSLAESPNMFISKLKPVVFSVLKGNDFDLRK
jgi:hypothetical protein